MLHLIKMAAGIRLLAEFEERRDFVMERSAQAGLGSIHMHVTRFSPKRAEEILAGGSLYWVFNKRIQVRQRIVEFREIETKSGVTKCGIVLDPVFVQVDPVPRKAFQGWRYLEVKDAPQDLGARASRLLDMPERMRHDLQELCLI